MAQYLPLYEDAAWLTLSIGWIGIAGSVIIGLIVAMIVHFRIPVLRQLCRVYIELFRNTPLLIQLFFFYFGLPRMGFSITPEVCGMVGLALHGGAYMAESVRGGIISIDKGQFEGAMSIGMTHSQTMLKVIIPQVMRNILPSVSNEFVINIKDTSVLNVIGVTELYYFAGIIKRQSFETFQTYLVVCVIYFILTFTVTRLLRWVERKLDGNDSYVIFGSQSDSAAEIRISREA